MANSQSRWMKLWLFNSFSTYIHTEHKSWLGWLKLKNSLLYIWISRHSFIVSNLVAVKIKVITYKITNLMVPSAHNRSSSWRVFCGRFLKSIACNFLGDEYIFTYKIYWKLQVFPYRERVAQYTKSTTAAKIDNLKERY